jgi:hypothetical protein
VRIGIMLIEGFIGVIADDFIFHGVSKATERSNKSGGNEYRIASKFSIKVTLFALRLNELLCCPLCMSYNVCTDSPSKIASI